MALSLPGLGQKYSVEPAPSVFTTLTNSLKNFVPWTSSMPRTFVPSSFLTDPCMIISPSSVLIQKYSLLP